MPETQETKDDQDKANNKKKWRSSPWLWWFLYGVLVLTGMSIGSLYFKNGADRAKFWVEGLLSAGVLSVVIVQAVIYRKQWQVMDRSLVAGNRAYVGVHSITEDFEKERIILMVENTGNVPAENLKVFGQVWVIIPKESGLAGLKAGFDHANSSFSKSFYNTRLFRGNLKSRIVIDLFKIALANKIYLPSVAAGSGATLWLIGSIEYGDGFDPGQITQFAFTYQGGEWTGASINDPELKQAKKNDKKVD